MSLRHTAAALLFALTGTLFAGTPAEPDSVRVGITSFGIPEDQKTVVQALSSVLEPLVDKHHLSVTYYTVDELEEAVRTDAVDIVLSSSGLFQRMNSFSLRSIATIVSNDRPDPNANEGAAIIVRSDRSDLTDIASLKGKVLSASLPNSFSGYHIPMGEITRRGYVWEAFFSETRFQNVHVSAPAIIEDVLAGRADVGFLRLCALERSLGNAPEKLAQLRLISEHTHDPLNVCRHSTALYPAHTVSIKPTLSAEFAKKLTLALLQQPPSPEGYSWSIATNFQTVDDLMRDLRVGPYQYLRQWNLGRMLREYWPGFAILLIIIGALGAHTVRSTALVTRKEEEVRRMLSEQARQAEKLDRLQKTGAVAQLASLVAHELRQPLGAIRLYAEGLQRAQHAGQLSAQKITDITDVIIGDAQRASDIVERIRCHVRGKTEERTTLSLSGLIRGAVRMMEATGRTSISIDLRAKSEALVTGSRLELEVAFTNLISNALDSSSANPKVLPEVVIDIRREESVDGVLAVTEISDSGKPVSDAVLDSLNTRYDVSDGRAPGLGLAITRHILESHGAVLRYRRREPFGLTARVEMPLCSR